MLNTILSKGMEIFGHELVNTNDFLSMLFNFGINFLFLIVIVRMVYMPLNKNRDYIFTFVIFNIVIFFIVYLLSDMKVKAGFGIGLFAVFSILRYRTDAIPIKEMTFLFVCIILAVLNALVTDETSILEIVFTNVAIAGATFVLEAYWAKNYLTHDTVHYEKIDLIKPAKREELLTDLRERTGLDIKRIEIRKIDLLTDSAIIRIFYPLEKD